MGASKEIHVIYAQWLQGAANEFCAFVPLIGRSVPHKCRLEPRSVYANKLGAIDLIGPHRSLWKVCAGRQKFFDSPIADALRLMPLHHVDDPLAALRGPNEDERIGCFDNGAFANAPNINWGRVVPSKWKVWAARVDPHLSGASSEDV